MSKHIRHLYRTHLNGGQLDEDEETILQQRFKIKKKPLRRFDQAVSNTVNPQKQREQSYNIQHETLVAYNIVNDVRDKYGWEIDSTVRNFDAVDLNKFQTDITNLNVKYGNNSVITRLIKSTDTVSELFLKLVDIAEIDKHV